MRKGKHMFQTKSFFFNNTYGGIDIEGINKEKVICNLINVLRYIYYCTLHLKINMFAK